MENDVTPTLIDWMKASAEWMRADRPDLYDTTLDALDALGNAMESVRENPDFRTGVETGGVSITRTLSDDGVESWLLARLITECVMFQPENEVTAYNWTKDSGAISVQPNLPAIEDLAEEID